MTFRRSGLIAGILLLLAIPCLGLAQTELPEMELRVTGVQGAPEIKADTATRWSPVKTDRTLQPGDRIRTREDETIELQVPAVSYFLVTEESLIEVRELNRTEEERGLLTTEEVIVNNIKLSEIRGKVQNSVKKHQGVATEYELSTPNAVAGIRGTDFQCEVTTFGQTECAVLEGNVRFSSLENPDASVNLGAGQQSSIGPDEDQPRSPSGISEETRQELQSMKNRAQSALRLKPTLSSFQINGTSFQQSVQIAYGEQATLTISGEASAPEDGAELSTVSARVDGEDRSVEGLSDWSLTLEPQPPEPGEKRSVTVELRAVDSLETPSNTTTLTITLVNQEQTTGGLPSNYEEGQVDVQLASLAGRSPDNVEFPFHAYRPDASEGGLTLRGEAEGDAAIENVGYSLDGGKTWQIATGAEQWTINLPAGQAGEYTVLVRAWTTAGVIGKSVEVGPINYQPVSYEQALREAFRGFWDAFEKQDPRGVIEYVHPDFIFEPNAPPDAPAEEREPKDRSGFQDFLRREFERFVNLRVFLSINTIFGNPQGGTLRADPVQWKTKLYFDREKKYYPAIIADDGSFKFRRLPNGEYKMLSFSNFRPKPFIGFDNVVMGDTEGYYVGPAQSVISNDREMIKQLNGMLIAGFSGSRTEWPGNPAKIYVNPTGDQVVSPGSPYYDKVLDYAWPCNYCEGPIIEGGIYKTPYSQFDQVDRVPGVSDNTNYNYRATLTEGAIYVVNLQGSAFGPSTDKFHFTYLMKVLSLDDTGGGPQYDQVRFRVVFPGGGGTRDFNNVNPFK